MKKLKLKLKTNETIAAFQLLLVFSEYIVFFVKFSNIQVQLSNENLLIAKLLFTLCNLIFVIGFVIFSQVFTSRQENRNVALKLDAIQEMLEKEKE